MSTEPQLIPLPEKPERNWVPMAVAAVVVIAIAVVVFVVLGHGKAGAKVTPISAPLDPYAASLSVTNLQMSESSSLSGGKVTYIDGHIENKGDRTVSGISVQVLFHNYAHEVAQNETHELQFIRMRDPYIDTEPVSAAPLAPGAAQDFRLIFDGVTPNWDGAYPDLRIVRVATK